MHKKKEVTTLSYLPEKKPVKVLITSGASCPDALVEGVITKLAGFYKSCKPVEEVIHKFMQEATLSK
jgi:4-hydroxy-3-methylbut-2-enyl diphosphate reductase